MTSAAPHVAFPLQGSDMVQQFDRARRRDHQKAMSEIPCDGYNKNTNIAGQSFDKLQNNTEVLVEIIDFSYLIAYRFYMVPLVFLSQ